MTLTDGLLNLFTGHHKRETSDTDRQGRVLKPIHYVTVPLSQEDSDSDAENDSGIDRAGLLKLLPVDRRPENSDSVVDGDT